MEMGARTAAVLPDWEMIDRAIRRGIVHAVRARASASVISALARRVNRFERGEGGGVT